MSTLKLALRGIGSVHGTAWHGRGRRRAGRRVKKDAKLTVLILITDALDRT